MSKEKDQSVFGNMNFESRSVKRSWLKLEKKVKRSVSKLNKLDLDIFLSNGVYFCPLFRVYYINPKLEQRMINMLRPIYNHKTHTVDWSVMDIISKIYKEKLVITTKNKDSLVVNRRK